MKHEHIGTFLFGFLLFCISCINENIPDQNTCEENILSLQLIFTSLEQATRNENVIQGNIEPGNADYNENKIYKVDIFFYNGETQVWYPKNVSYDAESGKVVISVSSADVNKLNATYDVYVVANSPFSYDDMAGKSLTDLKELELTTAFGLTNSASPQPYLVMDGVQAAKYVSLSAPDLGSVNMQRVAAKIRVRILSGENINPYIDEDTGITPYVAVMNYNEKGALLRGGSVKSGLKSDTEYKIAGSPYLGDAFFYGLTTPYPIYSYPNDWSSDRSKETYLMIRLPLKVPAGASTFTDFYYRVPISLQNPEGPQTEEERKFYRIDRNYVYDIEVFIDKLGGTEQSPVSITGNYVVKNWTTQMVDIAITSQHYFVINPLVSQMNNKTTLTLSYSSSKLPINVTNIKATYTYTDDNGNTHTDEYPAGSVATGTPSVATNGSVRVYIDYPSAGKITITSLVPVNNVPKDISFKASNGISALDHQITIQQLPSNYITNLEGKKSSQFPNDLTNHALYIINASIPDGTAIIGFPPIDPITGYTVSSSEVNKMISPSFMLASQLGATFPMDFTSAQSQCANYWEETIINGKTVRYEDFRLPTEAEIILIDQLQNDPNSAVKSIMTGKWYWDAKGDDGAHKMIGGAKGAQYKAYTRCVRDVKK